MQKSLLILGSGIVGAGIARDAALRGLQVTVIDKHTAGWGTSSRSSRMIHGGIRYLELGDFHLVHEALSERATLLHIAPKLVRATPFLFVLDEGEWWQWFRVGVGVMLYKLLAGKHALGEHHPLSAAHVIAREPLLRHAKLAGGAIYQDAHGDDIGLVHANVRSAEEAGARVLQGVHASVQVHDDHVTATLPDGEVINADAVVLALGPWTDAVRSEIGLPARQLIGVTKGIHIAFSLERVPLTHAIALRHPDDKRVMFCVPEPELGRVLVGTTDTETDESPDALTVSLADVMYLMRAVQHLFPQLGLRESDVAERWAGLRPLLHQSGKPSGRTREHLMLQEGRVITIAGGKLTTYRKMAEEAVDLVGKVLEMSLPACITGERILS